VFGSVAAVLLAACAAHAAGPTQAQLNAATNDGTNWLYVDHDYRGQRYMPLDQITAKNELARIHLDAPPAAVTPSAVRIVAFSCSAFLAMLAKPCLRTLENIGSHVRSGRASAA